MVRPSENEINTRPLKDWLARADALRNKGELDLNSEIEITIAAKLNPECRLIEANVVQKTGDARLLEVAKEMVGAIGDSGMLSFLRDPKKKVENKPLTCDEMPLQLTIKLNQTEISAKVETEATSPQRASEMASTYNGMLVVGQLNAAVKGKDEEVLYRNTQVTSADKKILVNFSMPRQTASEMLKKQLTKAGIKLRSGGRLALDLPNHARPELENSTVEMSTNVVTLPCQHPNMGRHVCLTVQKGLCPVGFQITTGCLGLACQLQSQIARMTRISTFNN